MPMIMVIPIMAEIFNSVALTQRPANTADTASSAVTRMDSAMRKLSYMNSSSRNTSAAAAANTISKP